MINTNLSPPTTPIESPASDAFDPGAFASIPLTALSRDTHLQLSKLLNLKKILRSEDGYERDYRGIGMLAELRGMYDENTGNMDKVLQLWCSVQPKSATFGKLEEYLGKIDRWDVSDDIHENLVKDANNFNAKQLQKSVASLANATNHNQNQHNNHCSSFDDSNTVTNNADNDDDNDWSSKPNILTRDDVLRAQQNLPPQQYDAFVLFAKEDVEYATQMLVLENDYNFKLCLKDRDLLAGVEFMHVALPQLIDERCKYLIAILTDQFFKSPENKFLVNFTQAHQIEDNRRKIIPVRYGNVNIPRTLSILTHLTYQQSNRFYDFWDRLADSIRHGSTTMQQPANGKCILASPPARETFIKANKTGKRIMRSSQTQLNLSNVHNGHEMPPGSTPTSQNITATMQTPSPAISEIPSISLNGEAIFPEELKEENNKLSKSNGHGLLNGIRRSATVGTNMSAVSNNDLTTTTTTTTLNKKLSKEQKQKQFTKSTILTTQSSRSSSTDQSNKNDSGCGKYKKRLPRFSKFLPKLRRANSTSQLSTNLNVNMCERTTSFSDLSMHSGISGCGSEQPNKKKKKWSHKLKRIFSRSSVKLQETA